MKQSGIMEVLRKLLDKENITSKDLIGAARKIESSLSYPVRGGDRLFAAAADELRSLACDAADPLGVSNKENVYESVRERVGLLMSRLKEGIKEEEGESESPGCLFYGFNGDRNVVEEVIRMARKERSSSEKRKEGKFFSPLSLSYLSLKRKPVSAETGSFPSLRQRGRMPSEVSSAARIRKVERWSFPSLERRASPLSEKHTFSFGLPSVGSGDVRLGVNSEDGGEPSPSSLEMPRLEVPSTIQELREGLVSLFEKLILRKESARYSNKRPSSLHETTSSHDVVWEAERGGIVDLEEIQTSGALSSKNGNSRKKNNEGGEERGEDTEGGKC